MIQRIWNYAHLAGWQSLITQLIADLDAATGPHTFRTKEPPG
jgi:hypothetical protein